MPRTARIAPQDFVYHVLTRGNNRQAIFKEDEDYLKYLELIKKYKEKYKFRLYHYALMTNHVHLVIEPTEQGGELSQIMKGISLSYAQYYKGKYKHIGHFWQDRYKSIIISKDEYLLACGSYVELNPVRAGIVKEPKDYLWSSYHFNAYGKSSNIIDEHIIYEGLSSDESLRREYRKFVREMLEKKKAMRGEMERRLIFGGHDFIRSVNKKYKLEAVIKRRGRPKQKVEEKHNK